MPDKAYNRYLFLLYKDKGDRIGGKWMKSGQERTKAHIFYVVNNYKLIQIEIRTRGATLY